MTVKVRKDNAWIPLSGGGGSGGAGAAVPSKTIVMYHGDVAPSGWVICDNSTAAIAAGAPDLRDKFIVATGSKHSRTDSGGSNNAIVASHSHTINDHTHSFSGNVSHRHGYAFGTAQGTPIGNNYGGSGITNVVDRGGITEQQQSGSPQYPNHHGYTAETGQTTASVGGNTGNPSDRGTDSVGSSATDANLPPYYALTFIMKI